MSQPLETETQAEKRRRIGCYERQMVGRRHPDDPIWCWCGYEIVWGIGECDECQEMMVNQ